MLYFFLLAPFSSKTLSNYLRHFLWCFWEAGKSSAVMMFLSSAKSICKVVSILATVVTKSGREANRCRWKNSSWFQEGLGQGCSCSRLAHLPYVTVLSWSHWASDGNENWSTVFSTIKIKQNKIKQNNKQIHYWKPRNQKILSKQPCNVEI